MTSSGDGWYGKYQPPRDQPTPQGNAQNRTYNLGVYNLGNSVQASLGNVNSFGPYSTQYGSPQVPSSHGYPAGAYGQAGQDYRYEAAPQPTSQYPREPSQNFSKYGANTSPGPVTSQAQRSGPELQAIERDGTDSAVRIRNFNCWPTRNETRDQILTVH